MTQNGVIKTWNVIAFALRYLALLFSFIRLQVFLLFVVHDVDLVVFWFTSAPGIAIVIYVSLASYDFVVLLTLFIF